MKILVAGMILLALYGATGPQRKQFKQRAQEVLDQLWEAQERIAETEEMKEWIRYWREAAK